MDVMLGFLKVSKNQGPEKAGNEMNEVHGCGDETSQTSLRDNQSKMIGYSVDKSHSLVDHGGFK